MLYKRVFMFASLLIVLTAVLLIAPTARAATEVGFKSKVVRGIVNFTIPADACSMLPAGIEVSGTGNRYQVLSNKDKPGGGQLNMSNDFIQGTATDNNGGTYVFLYTNQAKYHYPAGAGPIKLNMTDSFILDQTNGSNDYSVAFHWSWEFTPPDSEWPPNDNWVQHLTIGDPLTCDPL